MSEQRAMYKVDTDPEPALGKPKYCRGCGNLVGYVRKRWISTPSIPRARQTYFVPDIDCVTSRVFGYYEIDCWVCGDTFQWFGPDAPRPTKRTKDVAAA